jgi:hypothetical protein
VGADEQYGYDGSEEGLMMMNMKWAILWIMKVKRIAIWKDSLSVLEFICGLSRPRAIVYKTNPAITHKTDCSLSFIVLNLSHVYLGENEIMSVPCPSTQSGCHK